MAPKRSAPGAAGAAAKKAKKGFGLDAIVKALETAPGYPPQVGNMVASLIPFALETFKDVRHDFQNKVVEMAEQLLTAAEASLNDHVGELERRVETGPTEKTERETAVNEATAALEAAREAAKLKKVDLVQKSAAAKEAQVAHKNAVTAQKEGDKELIVTDGLQKKLEEVQAKVEAAAGHKKDAIAIVKSLKQFGLEDSLLNTAPSTLAKKVEDRGAFDAVVATQLHEAIKAKLEYYAAVLAEGAAGRTQREEAVAAAKASLDAANAARQEASKENDEAIDHSKASEEALVKAQHALTNHDSEMRSVAQQLDKAKVELAGFKSGPLATFVALKELHQPVPEAAAPEPEVPEPVAVPEEAAAAAPEVTMATD